MLPTKSFFIHFLFFVKPIANVLRKPNIIQARKIFLAENLLLYAGRSLCRSSLLAGGGFFSRRLQQLPDTFPACNIFLPLPVVPGLVPVDSRHKYFSVIKLADNYTCSRQKNEKIQKHSSCAVRNQRACHSEARHDRARNLLFRGRQKADSSPINPASELQVVLLAPPVHGSHKRLDFTHFRSPSGCPTFPTGALTHCFDWN
jgi:hypothetical protein